MKILGISGKKGSGKNTLANAYMAAILKKLDLCSNSSITDGGDIWVENFNDVEGETGILDLDLGSPQFKRFMHEQVYPHVKLYALADPIKEIAVTLFGIDPKLVYGNQADKNTPTQYIWENAPYIPSGASGVMTVRDVLSTIGNMCRKMSPSTLVEATFQRMQVESPKLAIITDVRFKHEVEAIHNVPGACVLRLTRSVDSDTDICETDLDNYDKFDVTLNNKDISVSETLELFVEWTRKMKIDPDTILEEQTND